MKNRLFIVLVLTALLLGGLSFPRPAQAGAAFCHTVRPGENLSQIAIRYGVTVQALVAANNLWNPNLIYVGQCLIIPSYAPPPPPAGCNIVHVVRRGEYVKMIAAQYGVSWQSIVQANGLANPNVIYPGQHLIIPGKCKPPKPTPCPPPKPCPTPKPTPGPTPGPWKGQFWNNLYLSGNPKLTVTTNLVDYNWVAGGPGGGIGNDSFSARFTRTRYFDAGQYRLNIQVDDGVRFWLDNVLLIDQWHDSGVVVYSVDRQLSAGQHTLQIDYYEHLGNAQIKFWVEPAAGPPAWKGEYFNNTNLDGSPAVTQYHSAIDFDWSNRAPVAGITADYFSARYTGEFSFVGDEYRFTATTDDGMRIWIDDTLILDQWHVNPVRTYEVDVDVSAGTHKLKIEYFENNGVAVARVRWAQR
jgi:LysM repeat protein